MSYRTALYCSFWFSIDQDIVMVVKCGARRHPPVDGVS